MIILSFEDDSNSISGLHGKLYILHDETELLKHAILNLSQIFLNWSNIHLELTCLYSCSNVFYWESTIKNSEDN